LAVDLVDIDRLRPNTYNPNQQTVNDFEMLVESMRDDGFTVPILVNDGGVDPSLKDMIIDGEHRWRAGKVLGMKKVPVVWESVDQAGMRIDTLRHNEARGITIC
jgi:ParB/RepB/Spo0J family partition protein